MSISAAKRFLMLALESERRIRDITEERRHLMDIAGHITAGLDGMPHGTTASSRVEQAAVALADLDGRLAQEVALLVRSVQDVSDVIAKVEDEKQRRILQLRYVSGLSWRAITDRMGYTSEKAAYYIHRRALCSVQIILKKRDPKNRG